MVMPHLKCWLSHKSLVIKCWPGAIRSDEGLTLETSALKVFTVANLRYQLS